MGLWMSRLLSLFGEKEARILVLGLDNAGKTTILCKDTPPYLSPTPFLRMPITHILNLAAVRADRLQVGEVVSTIPSTLALIARCTL